MRISDWSSDVCSSDLDFSSVEVASELPGLERQWQARRSLQTLEAAVEQLPDKCRTVFLLSRIEGLSNAEVAQRCGISVKMVEKHLAKAILKCRAQVGDRSEEHTSELQSLMRTSYAVFCLKKKNSRTLITNSHN